MKSHWQLLALNRVPFLPKAAATGSLYSDKKAAEGHANSLYTSALAVKSANRLRPPQPPPSSSSRHSSGPSFDLQSCVSGGGGGGVRTQLRSPRATSKGSPSSGAPNS